MSVLRGKAFPGDASSIEARAETLIASDPRAQNSMTRKKPEVGFFHDNKKIIEKTNYLNIQNNKEKL